MVDGMIEYAFYQEMGRKLALRRRTIRMSQGTLATEIGVHRNTVVRWEAGESSIGAWELMRISAILHCHHFTLMPSDQYVWGDTFQLTKRERDNFRKAARFERDPRMSDKEEAQLRARRTA